MLALCAMYFGAIYGWYFYLTWLPTYLLRARGFDLHAVGWLAALPAPRRSRRARSSAARSRDVLARRFGPRAGLRAPGPRRAAARGRGDPRRDRDDRPATPPRTASRRPRASRRSASRRRGRSASSIGGRHAGVVSGAMNTFGNLGGALEPDRRRLVPRALRLVGAAARHASRCSTCSRRSAGSGSIRRRISSTLGDARSPSSERAARRAALTPRVNRGMRPGFPRRPWTGPRSHPQPPDPGVRRAARRRSTCPTSASTAAWP